MKTNYRPVRPAERIEQIDILRGFALLGILLVNVFGYHASFYHFGEFYGQLTNPLESGIYWAMVNFGSDKFIFLFSILFGYGFWMLYEKFEEREIPFVKFYSLRMLSLCLFGILHIVLLWAGDILFIYGILGMLLLTIRQLGTKTLIFAALFFYFFTALFLILKIYLPFLPNSLSTTSALQMDEIIPVYSNGNFFDILLLRINEYITFRNINIFYYAPKVFALFIIGYISGKGKWLEKVNGQRSKFIIINFLFFVAGLFFILKLEAVLYFFSNEESQFFTALYIAIYETGNLFLGFGYLMMILLISGTTTGKRILNPFKYAGRMAFTNYLFQSVIFTTIFYGYGFGRFGNTNPSTFLIWAVIVFAFQVVFSMIWFSNFRYGPLEFIWRRMSYGNWKQK